MKVELGPKEQKFLEKFLEGNNEIEIRPENKPLLSKWEEQIDRLLGVGLLKILKPNADNMLWSRYTPTASGYIILRGIQQQLYENRFHLHISKIERISEYGMAPYFLITKNKPTFSPPDFSLPIPLSASVADPVGLWHELKYDFIRQLRQWFYDLTLGVEAANTMEIFFSSKCTVGEHQFFLKAVAELPTLDLGTSGISWQEILDNNPVSPAA